MSASRDLTEMSSNAILSGRALCCTEGHFSRNLALQPKVPGAAPGGGGLDVRTNRFVSLFAASLIALLPAHAFAQDTPAPNPNNSVSVRDRARPELDPQGVRLGGFTLNATLDGAVTSTDNLFAAQTNEQDDLIYIVSPSGRLSSNWSRHALSFEAGGSSYSHQDFDSEDVDTYYARANGRIDVSADTDIHGTVGTSHEFTPRTDPDLTSTGSPVEYDQTDASVGVAHRFGRFTARLDASQMDRQYDGTESVRDYDQTAVRARADVELSPRIGLLVDVTGDERDYDTQNLDSDGTTALVGVTIRGNLMRGEVSVGQFSRDYDDPTIGTVDGLAVSGELEWYATQLTTVTFTAKRGAEDNSTTGATGAYVTTEYGARIDHELLRNLILTAGARGGNRDYENVARQDDYVSYDVGADYWVNRRVALRARFTHDDVDSDGSNRTFDVNAATLGVSLRL